MRAKVREHRRTGTKFVKLFAGLPIAHAELFKDRVSGFSSMMTQKKTCESLSTAIRITRIRLRVFVSGADHAPTPSRTGPHERCRSQRRSQDRRPRGTDWHRSKHVPTRRPWRTAANLIVAAVDAFALNNYDRIIAMRTNAR